MKKQANIILFVLLGIFILGLAILIWANATGRITIGANMIPPPGPTPTSTIQGYPVCKSVTVSTAKAGWYDSVTNKLIKEDKLCAGYTAKCIGSTDMSRGWYKVSNTDPNYKVLIVYANCTLSPTTSPVPSPAPQCKSAQQKCVGNNSYSVCSKSGTWSGAINCPTGTTCQGAGQCLKTTPPCTNECSSGQTGCDGNNRWECREVNGCWRKMGEICHSPDYTCQNGQCVLRTQPTPTTTPTNPTPITPPTNSPYHGLISDKIKLNNVTCRVDDNGKQEYKFDFDISLPNEPMVMTPEVEYTYEHVNPLVNGTLNYKSLWHLPQVVPNKSTQVEGNASTKTFTITDVNPAWDKLGDTVFNTLTVNSIKFAKKWRIDLWTKAKNYEYYKSNPIELTNCDGSTPTVSPTPIPTVFPTTIAAPTNVYAAVQSATEMKLSWDPSVTEGVVYYNIYNASTNSLIKSVATSVNEISITGLRCDKEYKYYVTAGFESRESVPSNTAVATTSACGTGDDISNEKPGNISLDYIDSGLATINWDGVDGATGYDIYNCNGDYLVSTAQNSYSFTGNNCGQTLCYYVIAHNDSSESQKSDEASVNTEKCGGGGSDTPSTPSVTKLISTGASLWFNILIALLLILGIGYFMFRKDIHNI